MAFGKLLASIEAAKSGLTSLASAVDEHVSTIGPKIDELVVKADQLHHRKNWMKDDEADFRKSFDVLGDLYAKNESVQNDFSEKFRLGIESVRLGAIDIQDFIATWGDAEIATDQGFKKVREAFSGADLGQYRQQLQALIEDVTTGSVDIGQVITFLKDNAGDLAKGLIDVLDLFKAGKASLEDVQRVLDATKETFPGADADALSEAIRNAVLGGQL